MDFYTITFILASAVALAASLMVVASRNPLVSALFLALSFISTSVLFVLLQSHFLALVQILIYAGAVVVLFIYVIMLLDMSGKDFKGIYGMTMIFLGISLFICLAFVFVFGLFELSGEPFSELSASYSQVTSLAEVLFTKYVIPFELVSIVLMIGIIGGVMLIKNVKRQKEKV